MRDWSDEILRGDPKPPKRLIVAEVIIWATVILIMFLEA